MTDTGPVLDEVAKPQNSNTTPLALLAQSVEGINKTLERYQELIEEQAGQTGQLAKALAVSNAEFKQFRYQHATVVGQHEVRLGNLDNVKNGAVTKAMKAISGLQVQTKIIIGLLLAIVGKFAYEYIWG